MIVIMPLPPVPVKHRAKFQMPTLINNKNRSRVNQNAETFIQSVVGSFLYYIQDVDSSTIIMVLSELASQ